MKNTLKIIGISLLTFTTLHLSGCETDDDNKMLAAQDCFNNLRDGATDPQVDACMSKIAGINTDEADTLRCGMTMFKGGINTGKINTAFQALEDASEADKESALLFNLVMDNTTEADEAYGYCKDSGAAGLLYIATLARSATIMAAAAGGAATGNELIEDCIGVAGCEEDVGEMILDLKDTYCIGASADNDVCQAALAAIAAGGNAQAIGLAFLNQIDPP